MPSFNSEANAYIKKLSDDRRKFLEAIRKIVFDVVPEAEETFQYKMPTYEYHGLLFSMASQKHHVGLYFCNEKSLAKFKDKLKGIDCGKGCLRFRKLEDVPLLLVKQILNQSVIDNENGES